MISAESVESITHYTAICCVTVACMLLCGCAGIEVPTPEEIISHPIGTESIKIGMTRAQVEALWGKPDEVRMVEDKEKWNGAREMWVYRAQYGAIPVDAGYFSKSKRLYFDGDHLTNIGE